MLAIVIGVVIIALVYLFVIRKPRGTKTAILRFYSESCKYCIESQAEWDAFSKIPSVGKYSIRNININATDEGTRAMVDSYKITSVPTIIGVDMNGTKTIYTGAHTRDAYADFVNS